MNALEKPNVYAHQMMAEAQAWLAVRMNLGACVGMLHEPPTDEDLEWISRTLGEMQVLVDCARGLREACK